MKSIDMDAHFEKALEWLGKIKAESIMANFGDHEKPKPFINKKDNSEVIPDLSFIDAKGRKNYAEIVVRKKNMRDDITKWMLLSTMASFKYGKLFLLAPKGHKSFIDKIVKEHDLKATVFSI